MLHVLIGQDDFSIRQALDEIKKAIVDPAALMPNTSVLDGRQVTPQQLRAACDTVPFLAEKRLVIVEGLLGRFEPKAKTGRKKPSRQPDQSEEYKALAEGMKHLPPSTELVLMDGRINDRNPLLRELMSQAKVKSFL